MAYSWRLNGLKIRYFEDDEEERILTLKNAIGNRPRVQAGAGGDRAYLELSEHQRLVSLGDPVVRDIKSTISSLLYYHYKV